MVLDIFFWLFSTVIVISSIAVISARNPVHSVLFLILAFVNSSGLFVILGAEFIAMILLIVYVGAVAVLFLFVVMMLNIDLDSIRLQSKKYFAAGLLVGGILLIELIFSSFSWKSIKSEIIKKSKGNLNITNTQEIGNTIYTDYVFLFQLSGSILLVAMVGAIVLTLRKKDGVARQNINEQVNRKKEDTIELVDIKSTIKKKGV